MPRGVPKSGFRMTKKRMAKANVVAVAPQPVVESRFSINERFGFVSDMVMMLARGDQASVVVTMKLVPVYLVKSTLWSKAILHLKACTVPCSRIVTASLCLMIVILCCVILFLLTSLKVL